MPERCSTADGVLGITSMRADDGREMLASPASLVVVDDNSDTWAHGVDAFRSEIGRPSFESADVIEDGEHVRVVRQRGSWRDSYIELEAVTWRHTPVVELRLRADWREPRQILKFELPAALEDARTIAAVPGGVARRVPDGGEEPCQDWLAIEGTIAGDAYSIGVVNDATYAYDCLGGQLRMTLLRSAPYAEHDPAKLPDDFARPYLDQGWQERRLWLIAGHGPYTGLGLPRLAQELQSPAEYVMNSGHGGGAPRDASFLEVSPDNVVMLACKPAEDGDGVVVRLRETEGRATTAHIAIPRIGVDARVELGAWQIRSFLAAADGSVREVDLLERTV
jgi:alpha-mannosidase